MCKLPIIHVSIPTREMALAAWPLPGDNASTSRAQTVTRNYTQ